MGTSLLGTRVERREDPTLLTGQGQYVGDVKLPGCLHVRFVRSSEPHAKFRVDMSEAAEAAGVVAVYDFEALGGTMVEQRFVPDASFARGALSRGVVRYAGEPVALVVAETLAAAHDAAEMVVVDYEPLPPSMDAEAVFAREHGAGDSAGGGDARGDDGAGDAEGGDTAGDGGADEAGGDAGVGDGGVDEVEGGGAGVGDLGGGEAEGGDAPAMLFPERGSDTMKFRAHQEVPVFGADETVVTVRLENNRMAVAPLESQAVAVEPHDDGKLTVWLSSQGPHENQRGFAASLGLEASDVRVISPWVGGGFGGKGGWVPEHIAVARAAQLLGRPVRWLEDRTENLLSMHARHQIQYARLSVGSDGKIAALETHALADCGGYLEIGGLIVTATVMMAQGVYKIPQLRSSAGAACTNKAPTTAFRGAGRPQATCILERVIDVAAAETGIDPVELRLRNLLQPEDFPFSTPTGATYDTGDYAKTLLKATELADYDALRREQAERRERGDAKLLGIGVCCYVEITAGFGSEDYASVEIGEDGKVLLKAGTSSHGQGHETVFATIVADQLGVDLDDIVFVQSDTAEVPRGQGTGGSRSGQVGGSAVLGACEQVLEDARRLASHLLEADESDIVVADGGLAVAGVPAAKLTWAELASAAKDGAGAAKDSAGAESGSGSGEGAARDGEADGPGTASREDAAANGDSTARGGAAGDGATDLPDRLWAENDFKQENATYPFGTHICVVEVDSETGKVEVLRHIAVDDCGVVMNPMIVEGQQHGGIASGISQALWEHIVYDESGNPRTTNFAEYLFPSAAEFPSFEAHTTETPTDQNPLGVKGIGEAGTIGAIPAAHNAVIDALAHLGIRHLDMPLTPQKIWQAIAAATHTHSPDPAQAPNAKWPSYAS